MDRDIGIAFLSSPASVERIEAGAALLPAERVQILHPSTGRATYLAGEDVERTQALVHLLGDSQVKIILAGRGGYGAVRLVRDDLEPMILSNPKPIMGFSDVTALLFLWDYLGVQAIHGPVLTQLPALDNESLKRVRQVLTQGVVPALVAPLDPISEPHPPVDQIEGALVASNLSVLETLVGLDYFPDLRGKVVLLEDINEPPYKLDRMCTHLLMATSLREAAAVVLGGFGEGVSCDPLVQAFRGTEIPLFAGAPMSHGSVNYPLALGTKARVKKDQGWSLQVEACAL